MDDVKGLVEEVFEEETSQPQARKDALTRLPGRISATNYISSLGPTPPPFSL